MKGVGKLKNVNNNNMLIKKQEFPCTTTNKTTIYFHAAFERFLKEYKLK